MDDSGRHQLRDRRPHSHVDSSRAELNDRDQSTRGRKYRSHSRTPSPRRRSRSRSTSRGPFSGRPRSYSREPIRRSRSREKHNHKSKKEKRKRSRSPATSSSDSDSGSDRKRHKKKKHRTREEKERKRKEKKEKKKKKHATGSSSAHWGKYGVINDSDFFNKTQEFRTWLLEERKLNPEGLSKDQERKEFAVFVEDYNTATLPHEKYYHMEAYEQRMTSLRSGEFVPPPEDKYDAAADMKAHASRHKKAAADQESYMSREQLMELRKVQHERVEIGRMKRLGMDVKQNMGVRMDGSMFDG
ncbi:hypothetical protein EV363DRAFT_1164839 [Boletus edulis]|uniref:Uncharacterized protein n=1 Tax=Boletus edulis BED1 TaxID=1328754 RepID=A0AAD4BVN4_BOLED|nr:hypothetical protein EV363DRAFT_1164839 [Boletus edulis]KAF8441298.1 hypothetical protein L210DRAFT_844334 [Boletus edulis BED1]